MFSCLVSNSEKYFNSTTIGTGSGCEPVLFLVFLFLVVTELFSKLISEILNSRLRDELFNRELF
jgi:hypothetical protein